MLFLTFSRVLNSEVDIKDGAIKEIFNAKAYATEEDVEISAFLKYIDSKEATDDFTDKINYITKPQQKLKLTATIKN